MIKKRDYKYLNTPDYSLAGERFFKNSKDYLSANTVVNAAYLTSNEQLDKYLPQIGVAGKKIATVGSSGDQVLNSLLYGCKDITLIDANVLSEAYIEYKMALIKTYSFEDFRYVMFDDKCIFDWMVYSQISHHLSKDVKQFFDEIMLLQEETEYRSAHYYQEFSDLNILNGVVNHLPHTEFSEFYHSKEAYKKLQAILRAKDYKLSYIVSRLEDFPKRLPEKYDVILLSNIYDYVFKPKFKSILNKLYQTNLKNGGVIQFQYFFEDGIFRRRPPKIDGMENVEIIELHAHDAEQPTEKDRDECKVYLLKKPNSKELELG